MPSKQRTAKDTFLYFLLTEPNKQLIYLSKDKLEIRQSSI